MNSKGPEPQPFAKQPVAANSLGGGLAQRFDLASAVSFGDLRRTLWKAIALLLALLLAGGGAPTALQTRARVIKTASALPDFSFIAWEIDALAQTLTAGRGNQLDRLTVEAQVELVRGFLERRAQIGQIEEELNRVVSQAAQDGVADGTAALSGLTSEQATADLRREMAALRGEQAAERPLVEAVLERQVREELVAAGLGLRGFAWPPVRFTFIEPPLKLTVSPRDRISTIHSRVLQTAYDPVTLGQSEQAIRASADLSAHISRIGGMAVYPAMVVEQASLQWVLSTVAHEWVHHYLFLFPLGLRYAASDQLTTLNETASEIVGDEIGARLARRYYPEALPPQAATDGPSSGDDCSCNTYALWSESFAAAQQRWERRGRPLQFDFQREMRETRLHVDALLEAGLVQTAEAYMEARRRYFVAQGHPLRVLNQAYFAFHGNYATGAASSSPIGPQLQRLRAESDDLAQFLATVRWFTSLADLEKALAPLD